MAVTLNDIAKAAGVSRPTVSRALRNDPTISDETKRRILLLTRKMKYRPDPALTALAAYRHARRRGLTYEKIAILARTSEDGRIPPIPFEQIRGIRLRADQLGFETEIFAISPDEREQRSLSRALYHRGIRGVVVTPLRWNPANMDWRKFVIVGLGENAMTLGLNYVTYDRDHALEKSYFELKRRGYRKIGYCNLRQSEERNRFLFCAGYLKCLQMDGVDYSAPYLYESEGVSLRPWIRKQRFDAIIAPLWDPVARLRSEGFDDPRKFGISIIAPATEDRCAGYAAYSVDHRHLGGLALDALQGLMQKNQFGLPRTVDQISVHIRGTWRAGASVRAIKLS